MNRVWEIDFEKPKRLLTADRILKDDDPKSVSQSQHEVSKHSMELESF